MRQDEPVRPTAKRFAYLSFQLVVFREGIDSRFESHDSFSRLHREAKAHNENIWRERLEAIERNTSPETMPEPSAAVVEYQRLSTLLRIAQMGQFALRDLRKLAQDPSQPMSQAARHAVDSLAVAQPVPDKSFDEIESYLKAFGVNKDTVLDQKTIDEMTRAVAYAASAKRLLEDVTVDVRIDPAVRKVAISMVCAIADTDSYVKIAECLFDNDESIRLAVYFEVPAKIREAFMVSPGDQPDAATKEAIKARVRLACTDTASGGDK